LLKNLTTLIIATLSKRRFDTYHAAAGHDPERALALYLWNAKLGASFHVPIQAVEVALRNRVNNALMTEFGRNWWKNGRFSSIIDRERVRDLDTVRSRIIRKGLKLETDQIVAGLSFGFWVGMLQPKYNPPIWGAHLRPSFPHLPVTESRTSLFKLCGDIATFRNRISHHEPLLKSDVTLVFSEVMKLLAWLCPDTEKWVRPHCEVPIVIRSRP
jgi:hypothetical protein